MTDASDMTEDERRLRFAVADEIQAVMDARGVGGLVILCSPEAAAWRFVFPKWSGLMPDVEFGMRLRLRAGEPDSHERAEATMHLVMSVAEIALNFARSFGSLWDQAKQAIESQGGEVVHRSPYAGGPDADREEE